MEWNLCSTLFLNFHHTCRYVRMYAHVTLDIQVHKTYKRLTLNKGAYVDLIEYSEVQCTETS